jgi:hypothetical protein
MASDLFDFINGMFARPEEFKKTKMHERGKHFFMVNRLMSIQFPVQASAFNHIKINGAQVVTFWQEMLSRKYNRTPGWMYVKTRKEKEAKKASQVVNDETIRKYCEVHKISRRDVDDALAILGEPMYNELKQFEQITQD